MQLIATCSFIWLLLDLLVVLGNSNNALTTSLIRNQLSLLEKPNTKLDNVSKCRCRSIWVYDKMVTNIGNAYNPSTGKFSAPTTGIYQFNWYTLCNPGSMACAGLFVNGKFTANQVYNNGGGIRLWITAGSSIALSLKKGDEVYIMDVHGGTAPTLRSYFTAFGGVRIN
uniref:C1q domain-containing protein n=1 Tax=Magallana gigas TaxID=29159 RepID=A0A8W8KJ80_MAGGI